MENTSTVIFLDYFENLDRIAPIVRRICAGLKHKPLIVSSNFDNNPLSTSLDLKIIYFDELLSKEDYKFMDRYVFDLTQTWYEGLKPIRGITGYKGIQFGALVEERAQCLFSSAIKRLEIVLKIIECFHPDRIILIGEPDIFANLSGLIKEELNISSSFIEVREKDNSLGEMIKKLYRCIVEIISTLLDSLMRKIVIRRKSGNNRILIDTRLYFELGDLRELYHPYLYLIEKGLRIRLRLIKNEKLLFAPVLAEDSFRLPKVFSNLYRYWRFVKADTRLRSKFSYKDLLIWSLLEGIIKDLIIYDFSQAKKNVIFLERLYRNLVPKVVVLREAVRVPEKTIVFAARQEGIPTLVIQHGILSGRNVSTKLHSDKFALWGKAGIDWCGIYGNDISKCIVTGNPKHDLIYSRRNNLKRESQALFLKIGADYNKQTILYLAAHFKFGRHQPSVYFSQDEEYIALNPILNIARCFPDKQIIIKLHPFDELGIDDLLYGHKIKDKYTNIFVVKNVDLMPLIENSSLVITSQFSSAAIDAVILNKPVITLNLWKTEDLVPFAQRGVALSVTKPEHLCQAVRQIFEDKKTRDWFGSNRESFMFDCAYKIDGKSSERVLGLIKRICNESISNKK